jgi:hypothetical protein
MNKLNMLRMKKWIKCNTFYLGFISAIILIKCTNPTTNINTETNTNSNLNIDKKNSLIPATSFGNLEGTWFYSNYIDSTIKYKKIFDYIDYLSRDRYEISFSNEKPDTAFFKGYWESNYWKIQKVNENTYMTYGDTLKLIKMGEIYVLNYIPYSEKNSGKKYYYFKKDLSIPDIKEYFAKNIFTGKYHDIDRNKEVIFKDDFSINGLDKITSYLLSEGTSEYSDGMDILSLKGLQGFYHWRFDNDTLILQRAYPIEDDNGPKGFELGEIEYKLKKEN